MKSAQQILDHVKALANNYAQTIEDTGRIVPLKRLAELNASLAAMDDLARWIEAPVPFDRDLMGSSDDKE